MPLQEQIKVDTDTKNLLDNLKLVQEEPYNSVIKRLILHYAETMTDVTKETSAILLRQVQKIHDGKVKSFNDVLKEFRERNGASKKTHEEKREKKNKRDTSGGDLDEVGG